MENVKLKSGIAMWSRENGMIVAWGGSLQAGAFMPRCVPWCPSPLSVSLSGTAGHQIGGTVRSEKPPAPDPGARFAEEAARRGVSDNIIVGIKWELDHWAILVPNAKGGQSADAELCQARRGLARLFNEHLAAERARWDAGRRPTPDELVLTDFRVSSRDGEWTAWQINTTIRDPWIRLRGGFPTYAAAVDWLVATGRVTWPRKSPPA